MIAINRQRLLDRFLQYVRFDTTADANSSNYPSSAGQLELGKLLVQQLKAMSITDAHQDQHGLVWGTVPSTVAGPAPTILLNSHLDTSPETTGKNVSPQVISSYNGEEITLGTSGLSLNTLNSPALLKLIGKTLITTDGTTLLGGDDKAGVAIIMELAQTLIENPHLPHGPVRLLFTCDEEIGQGTKHVSLDKVQATAGYTLDGGGSGSLDVETFSADQATVLFRGKNIHPSIAKGCMINTIRAVGHFIDHMPKHILAPEVTDGRQGFMHPYVLQGGVAESKLLILLRDFDTQRLTEFAKLLEDLAHETELLWPGLKVKVDITQQYRNMGDGLRRFPLVADLAEQAFAQLNRPCQREIIRGGTDGALLTALGLPTPNLSSGQYNIHSPLEFACLDEMLEAIEHLVVLLDLWQQHGRS
ncbi:MAG: peptidase T [Planctomycetaceae bacterium]|nr:peptidase T [Planctomycetaceae bacterium]